MMIRLVVILFVTLWVPFTYSNTLKIGVAGDDIVVDETLKKLSMDTGIRFEVLRFNSYESTINALKLNKIDFISNINFTEERDDFLDFTLPFSVDYSFVFSNIPIINSHVDEFVVKKGSAYPDFLRRADAKLKISTYGHSEKVSSILRSNKNIAVLGSLNELEELLSKGYYAQRLLKSWFVPPASFASLKGKHSDYISLFNKAIDKNQYLSRSLRFVEDWENALRISALRTSVSLHGLDTAPVINYKSEDLYKDGIVRDSSVSRIAVERACVLLGFECKFTNDIDESWESIYSSLKKQEIDMISSMAVSREREAHFNFSEIYYYPNVYFVSDISNSDRELSLSEVVSERIGVIKGDYFEQLLKELLVGKSLYLYETQDDLTTALIEGHIDIMPIGSANFHKLMFESDYKLPIEVMRKFKLPIEYGIAAAFQNNKQGEAYAKLFSEALQIVDFQKLIGRYNYRKNWRTSMVEVQNLVIIGSAIIAIAGVVMFVIIIALYKESLTDQLTDLGNRRALYRKVKNRLPKNSVLLYVDIDEFKYINDNYGHEAGDRILARYAQIISSMWPGNAYRIGGDEFILICDKVTPGLSGIVTQLRCFQINLDGIQMNIEASLGCLIVDMDKLSLGQALAVVDKRMYQDKKSKCRND